MYQLFHKGALVYVGQARSLIKRLEEHRGKISGRKNINVEEMGFKCLYVHPNWTALAPEHALIKYHRNLGRSNCPWNGNGFGPHDPGRERETTNKAPDGFDSTYPIRDDWVCSWIKSGEYNVEELLRLLKSGLPYLLRFETAEPKSQKPHPDLLSGKANVPSEGMCARDLLKLIAMSISGWQATAFPSHMILYKEHRRYKHGTTIWLLARRVCRGAGMRVVQGACGIRFGEPLRPREQGLQAPGYDFQQFGSSGTSYRRAPAHESGFWLPLRRRGACQDRKLMVKNAVITGGHGPHASLRAGSAESGGVHTGSPLSGPRLVPRTAHCRSRAASSCRHRARYFPAPGVTL